MVVAVVDSSLFLRLLDRRLDERGLGFGLVGRLLALLLVCVLQVPLHEHVLLLKLLVFLLVGPDIDQCLATNAQDAMEL